MPAAADAAAVSLTPGNTADITVAPVLLDAVAAAPARLLADKAYDADAFRDLLKAPVGSAIERVGPLAGAGGGIGSTLRQTAISYRATTSQPSPSWQSLVSRPPD